MPLKLYYFTNFFRYEKPQAGRSREFFQFGLEMFGTSKATADATVISVADTVFKKLGVNARLNINSIGCPDCRPDYHKALVDYFSAHEQELCDTCKERLKTNPLRILDCKSPICGALCDNAPKTVEHLCDACSEHFDELKASLSAMKIDFDINPRIVRGLDYYTRTVFEFISDDIGAQSTVCGGGRYDGLVKELDGPELCGIGFGLGVTRLVLAMKKNAEKTGEALPENKKPLIYIAPMGKKAEIKAVELVHALRTSGIAAECDITGRSLKAQMKYADKIGATYAAVIGDNELETGMCELKNLRNGEKSSVSIDSLATIKE
jgi:histidyl-tRNA synthetase